MGYKINIRNAANDGWINMLQAQYVSVVDTNNHFTSDFVEGALGELFDNKAPRHEATVDPTASDDSYQTGAIWVNTASDEVFVCVDATASAAVWKSASAHLTQEEVEDYVGAMVSGNTENGIAVTYDDVNGKLDFDVNDPTLSISGDATGSAVMTDLGSTDIAITLSESYYTETEADDRFVNVTGDTMTGSLALTAGDLTLPTGTNVNEFSTDGTLAGASDTALPTEQAVKTYVDSKVSGLDWKESVKDKDLNDPPSSPSTGDRYIVSQGAPAATGDWSGHDNEFTEWDGSAWQFETITEGAATWVEDEDVVYVWNGTTWAKIGTTITHNNTNGLQGGNTTERFHLTSAEHTSITGSKSQNLVFASPDGSAGVGGFRSLVSDDIPSLLSTKITDFTEAAQDAFGALVTAGTQTNITVTYDDANNKVDYSVAIAQSNATSDVTKIGLASFDSSQFSVDANGFVKFSGGSTVDHGSLLGLGDDDHTQYVHIANARTITAQHTFAPASDQAPFVLGTHAQSQLVTGLNADMVDGHHWGSSATASAPATTLADDIWVEVTA